MKTLLLCSATEFELAPLLRSLGLSLRGDSVTSPGVPGVEFQALVTGPGMVQTALGITHAIYQSRPTALLHIGVAGGRPGRFETGDVVQVISDFFADAGAETAQGELIDMFDMGLWQKDAAPFHGGIMVNPLRWHDPAIPSASGGTVNRIPGTLESQARLAYQRDFDVESMEGAAVFLSAWLMGIPFHCLRGISNPIAPRDRSTWRLEEAVFQVCSAAERLIVEWSRN